MKFGKFLLLLCFILIVNEMKSQTSVEKMVDNAIDNAKKAIENRDYPTAISWTSIAKNLYEKLEKQDTIAIEIPYLFSWAYTYDDQLDSAQFFVSKAIAKIDKIADSPLWLAGRVYDLQGIIFQLKDESQASNNYFEKALDVFESLGNAQNYLSKTYNHLAVNYSFHNQYEKAIGLHQKSLGIQESLLSKNDELIADTYFNLAILCIRQGRYEKALEYISYAQSMYDKIFEGNYSYMHAVYSIYGAIAFEMGDYEVALKYNKKALENWQMQHGNKPSYYSGIYLANIGSTYLNLDKPILDAIAYIERGLEVRRSVFGEQNAPTASSYHDLGLAYLKSKNYSKAHYYFQKALDIRILTLGEDNALVAIPWMNLGEVRLQQKQFIKAQYALEQAAKVLAYDLEEPLSFNRVTSAPFLEELLQLKSALFKKQPQHFDSLIINQSYEIALQDYLQQSLLDKNSRQQQMSTTYSVVERAIGSRLVRNKKGDLEKAFEYSEKNKSRLLSENLRLNGVQGVPGLPLELREKERHLNEALTEFEKKIFQVESGILPDSLGQRFQDSVFDIKQQQEKLVQKFESSYPDYYAMKYSQNSITISQIQRELNPNECLVEYFVGDSTLFIFGMNPNQFLIKEIPLDFPLNTWIEQFREGIFKYWMAFSKSEALFTETKEVYTEKAYQLYEKLILPINEILTNKLIIIPDGNLGLLPFSALLSQPTDPSSDFSSYPYLVKDHTISYDFSATLHWQENKRKKSPPKLFAGFAPEFRSSEIDAVRDLEATRNALGTLMFNTEEVKSIESIYGGELFLGQEATLEKFKADAKNYRLLHLATHGKSNNRSGEYSFIAFQAMNDSIPEGNYLYVSDLYNIDLAADLVVLSACETGLGEMKRGEGIVGLATGFTFAGAQSILPSLWSVNDRVTADLMVELYNQFQEGLPKDEALAVAQRKMLENPNFAAPYYWAAFIPIGNMEPIHTNFVLNWLVFLGIPALLLLWFFIFRRLTRNRGNRLLIKFCV